MVKLVVKVLINLAGGTILNEKTAEDTEATHPHDLTVIHSQPDHFKPGFLSLFKMSELL